MDKLSKPLEYAELYGKDLINNKEIFKKEPLMKRMIEVLGRHILLLLLLAFILGNITGIVGAKRFFYYKMDEAKTLERMIYKGDIYTFVIDTSRIPPTNLKVK